jgi:hypothetical protein
MSVRKAIFDRHVAALYIASSTQTLMKRSNTIRVRITGSAAEEPDHRHCRLLRAPQAAVRPLCQ